MEKTKTELLAEEILLKAKEKQNGIDRFFTALRVSQGHIA